MNQNKAASAALCEIVSAFEAFVSQYGVQLGKLVLMKSSRRDRLLSKGYQDLSEVAATFENWFGIKLFDGLKEGDVAFTKVRFHRRHVYVHKGGQVDQKYIDDSGDTSVRLGQAIAESVGDTHQIIGFVAKMARNVHEGFHEILVPNQAVIEGYRKRMTGRQ